MKKLGLALAVVVVTLVVSARFPARVHGAPGNAATIVSGIGFRASVAGKRHKLVFIDRCVMSM